MPAGPEPEPEHRKTHGMVMVDLSKRSLLTLLDFTPGEIGYLLDLAFGDPRTIPHPVVGFGNMISWAERHFNCGRFRKWKGAVVALSFPLFVGMIGWGITVGTLAVGDWCFCIVASVFVFYGLANHSLIQEGREVIDTLKKQGVEAGRRRLSWIVGRDTSE